MTPFPETVSDPTDYGKKKKETTILQSWHIYVDVLQKVKIKRRNLH